MKLSGLLPLWGSLLKNEAILDGHGNCLMPAKSIFQKHCFFKKCPKNLTNYKKFQTFFCISCCNFMGLFNGISFVFILLLVWEYRPNRKSGNWGYAGFLSRLYIQISSQTFWSIWPKPLRVWKQTIYHWKAP